MIILKNKTYDELIRHKNNLNCYKEENLKLIKELNSLIVQIESLKINLKTAYSKGFSETGEWVTTIFKLKAGENLPIGCKDIVLIDQIIDGLDKIFYYQVKIWKSLPEDNK